MQRRQMIKSMALAGLAALGRPALAAEPGPVTLGEASFDPQAAVGGQSLLLNGAGIRYKLMFQVYAAGLYLPKKATTTDEVHAQQGPKRLRLVMLRKIDSSELGRMFTQSMTSNLDKSAAMSKLVAPITRMGEMFSKYKTLDAGGSLTADWLPGKGTQIYVNDTAEGGPLDGGDLFFRQYLNIWLGPQPADAKLKAALLAAA